MSFEDFERGYLLPEGCKDLIDEMRLARHANTFLKLPLLHSTAQAGVSAKPALPAPAPKGDIFVSDCTTVKELAVLVRQKALQIICDAMELGVLANVNQALEFKAILKIAEKYGYAAKRKA